MDPRRLLADLVIPPIKGPGIDPGAGGGVASMEKIIGQIIGILTIIAVLYFVFQIILAGYAYISSEGEEKNMEIARHRLTGGILGLTIVVVAVGLGSLLATLAGIPNIMDLEGLFKLMGL
jgi:hypothetical protein